MKNIITWRFVTWLRAPSRQRRGFPWPVPCPRPSWNSGRIGNLRTREGRQRQRPGNILLVKLDIRRLKKAYRKISPNILIWFEIQLMHRTSRGFETWGIKISFETGYEKNSFQLILPSSGFSEVILAAITWPEGLGLDAGFLKSISSVPLMS